MLSLGVCKLRLSSGTPAGRLDFVYPWRHFPATPPVPASFRRNDDRFVPEPDAGDSLSVVAAHHNAHAGTRGSSLGWVVTADTAAGSP